MDVAHRFPFRDAHQAEFDIAGDGSPVASIGFPIMRFQKALLLPDLDVDARRCDDRKEDEEQIALDQPGAQKVEIQEKA